MNILNDPPIITPQRVRDPELSRKAPTAASERAWLAAKARFMGAVQEGENAYLPSGPIADISVSDWITECAPGDARELMVNAAHHIACGRLVTGAELYRGAINLCAERYADENEGAFE